MLFCHQMKALRNSSQSSNKSVGANQSLNGSHLRSMHFSLIEHEHLSESVIRQFHIGHQTILHLPSTCFLPLNESIQVLPVFKQECPKWIGHPGSTCLFSCFLSSDESYSMNQSLDGFLPAVYALLYQVFTLFSAVYALLYQEFTCFSVKNRSVKVILSSDEFTTAIYMLSVVEKSFLCSQSLNQSVEVESAIKPLSVTIYAPLLSSNEGTQIQISQIYTTDLRLPHAQSLNRCVEAIYQVFELSVIKWEHLSTNSSLKAFLPMSLCFPSLDQSS